MKAKINGIEVEGTPEEVAAYLRIMDDMRRDGINIKPPLGKLPDWLVKEKQGAFISGQPTVYAGTKCWAAMNGGCNCTGACMK